MLHALIQYPVRNITNGVMLHKAGSVTGREGTPCNFTPLFAAVVLAEVALDICEAVKKTNRNRISENMATEELLSSWATFWTGDDCSVESLHARLELWLILAGKLNVTHTCKDTNITQAMQVNF